MTRRKAITKKTRFEVFKRDKFRCQYCGNSAPEIILQIDHIVPVSKGGNNEIMNLITACVECNSGKRARLLSDDDVIRRQKIQLDELQDRREQLAMMLEWQKELANFEDTEVEIVCDLFESIVPQRVVNGNGKKKIKRLNRIYGVSEVLHSLRLSVSQYLEFNEDQRATDYSAEKTFDYIERIARSRKLSAEKPYMNDLYYIRGILKNRVYLSKAQTFESLSVLERSCLRGVSIDVMKDYTKTATDYYEWSEYMDFLADQVDENEVTNAEVPPAPHQDN